MKAITTRQKIAVARALLSGSTTTEISRRLGISSGSVSNVFTEFREGSFAPVGDIGEQVDELRELALELKKVNLSPGRCLAGLIILSDISDCGLEPSDIRRFTSLIKTVSSEEDLHKYLTIIRRIADIEVNQGLDIQELETRVIDLEKKANELQPLVEQREHCESEINTLSERQEGLATAVNHLEEKHKLTSRHFDSLVNYEERISARLQALQSDVDEAEIILANANRAKKEMALINLSLQEITNVCRKIESVSGHRGIATSKLIAIFLEKLEKLDKGFDLESSIRTKQSMIDAQASKIEETQQEHLKLIATVESLKKAKLELESSIVEIKQKILSEISKIAPATAESVNKFIEELKNGNKMSVSHLKEQESEHNKVILAIQREEDLFFQHLDRTKTAIEQVRTRALEEMNKATQKMASDIATWGNTRAALNAQLDDLKYAEYFASFPLTPDKLDKLVDNMTIPIMIQYLYITETFYAKNLKLKMKPPKWLLKKYYSISEYTDVEIVDLIKWIRDDV